MKCVALGVVAIATGLASCSTYPRFVNFLPDPGGRDLNSVYAEINPVITGRYVVFASDRDGSQNIYLYDLTTRQLIDLPDLNALDTIASHPSVSADGRYIVFAASRVGETNIYLYDRELRVLRNLTANLRATVRHPTISADGNTIAFESGANGQWDILLYNRTGQPLNVPTNPR